MVRGIFPLCVWLTACMSLVACRLEVDYVGSSFACSLSSDCPAGQSCIDSRCLVSAEGTDDDTDAGNDADSDLADGVDAAAPVADADPPADAAWPPNLLADPGFERGEDDWVPYLASAALTTSDPHGGAQALRICKDPTGRPGYFSAYRDLYNGALGQLPPGTPFRAYGYVRASGSASDLPPSYVSAVLRERGGPLPLRDHPGDMLSPVTDEWILFRAEGTIADLGRTGFTLLLETNEHEEDNACFVIDDLYVGRLD